MKSRWILLSMVLFACSTMPRTSGAQARVSDSDYTALQDRVRQLEQLVERLENRINQLEAASGKQATSPATAVAPTESRLDAIDQKLQQHIKTEQDDLSAKAPTTPVVSAGAEGFTLQSRNGDYRLTLGMTAQTDGRFSLDSPTPITNTFSLRKIRPTFTGRVGKYFDFRVMPDFGNGTTVIMDAYFDIRFRPEFRIRTGKDKTPIGYELLQGDVYLLFPERALASSLVPNRDLGFQLQGDIKGGKLFYAVGVFNGIPDGTSSSTELDTNNSKDFAGRIVWQPFKSAAAQQSALSGLGVQVGGSNGREFGTLPSFKTSVGQTYFSYATTASAGGVRNRISPAVFYYYKSFGAFAEYMRSTQGVTRAGNQTSVTNQGWEITGSFLLTGEAASDRGIRPKRPFDLKEHTWGALQLLGRYSVLTVDQNAFTASLAASTASREARAFTVGTNWYPIYFVKIYGNFERTVFRGGAPRPPENVIFFRTQLAF